MDTITKFVCCASCAVLPLGRIAHRAHFFLIPNSIGNENKIPTYFIDIGMRRHALALYNEHAITRLYSYRDAQHLTDYIDYFCFCESSFLHCFNSELESQCGA